MILYTFQSPGALREAKKTGYITSSEKWAREHWNEGSDHDWWEGKVGLRNWTLKETYEYMIKQMAKRVPNYSGDYPVWAYGWKPELVYYRPEYKAGQIYMTIDVPEERVMLSSFEGYHFVMGGNYFAISEEEDRAIEKKYPNPNDIPRDIIEKSWERIFDKDLKYDPDWLGDLDWQACIDRVYLHEIKTIRQLKPWGEGQLPTKRFVPPKRYRVAT